MVGKLVSLSPSVLPVFQHQRQAVEPQPRLHVVLGVVADGLLLELELDDRQGLLHRPSLAGLGLEVAGDGLDRVGALGEFGEMGGVEAQALDQGEVVVAAGDPHRFGDQRAVAGGGPIHRMSWLP